MTLEKLVEKSFTGAKSCIQSGFYKPGQWHFTDLESTGPKFISVNLVFQSIKAINIKYA